MVLVWVTVTHLIPPAYGNRKKTAANSQRTYYFFTERLSRCWLSGGNNNTTECLLSDSMQMCMFELWSSTFRLLCWLSLNRLISADFCIQHCCCYATSVCFLQHIKGQICFAWNQGTKHRKTPFITNVKILECWCILLNFHIFCYKIW